MEPAV
jgi:hypothetical protein